MSGRGTPRLARLARWLRGPGPELLGLLLVALLAGLFLLQRHPLSWTAPEAEQAGAVPPAASRPGATDVALLLSWRQVAARAHGPFSGRDWSAWWINVLEQEVGPFALLAAETLQPEQLQGLRVLVLAADGWDGLPAAGRQELQRFLDRGGVVLAEGLPPGVLRGGPGLIAVPAVATGLLQAQQGWHGEAMVLRTAARFPGVPAGSIQPHALVPAGSPSLALEPLADRRERELWARVEQQAPVARWWYFPVAAAGVVAQTHDEEGFGDRSCWMAEHEADLRLRSTIFVIPEATMTRAGAAALLADGADVQLHWNRGFAGLSTDRLLGWGPFHPAVHPLTLAEQRQSLADLLPPGHPVTLNRNHGLVWDAAWGRSFRILAAAGFAADSTYGPAGEGRFGYLFGTGLPFVPLDDDGLPLPLHEVPFLFQDDEEYSPARQEELLLRSEQGDHQLLVPIYHVNTMARAPALMRMQGWLALPALAAQHRHRVMDLGSFLRFWWDRARSPIRSRFHEGTLAAEVQALAEELTLRVPARVGQQQAGAIAVDGAPFPRGLVERYAGSVLIPLGAGRHVVEVEYR